jgi:hypothetical protein
MAVGDRMHGRIFQVRPDLYERRVEDLRLALTGLPATRNDLRCLGVDYLFWGDDERRYFKFDPDLPVVNRIGSTVLYSIVNLEGEPASLFPLPTVASLPASLSRAGHGPAPCDQGGIPPWIPRRAVPRGKPRDIFPLVKLYWKT